MRIDQQTRDAIKDHRIKVVYLPLTNTGYLIKSPNSKQKLLFISKKYQDEFTKEVRKNANQA